MNEVRCPKCNKLASKAKGNFKLVNYDCDIQIQCTNAKCKTKLNIKLERL